MRKHVRGFSEERLSVGLGSTETVEADAVAVKGELTSDKAMAPVRIDREVMPEQRDAAVLAGSTNEDHVPVQRRLEVEPPV
jgi:hypothetical protein